jgi:hypothetical protein
MMAVDVWDRVLFLIGDNVAPDRKYAGIKRTGHGEGGTTYLRGS